MSSSRAADPSSQSTRRNIAVGVGVVVLAVAASAVWWFTRPAPEAVSIDDAVADASANDEQADPSTPDDAGEESGDEQSEDTGGSEAGTASPDGTWTVDTGIGEFSVTDTTGTFVGFRIDEELSNIGATTAIGRTPAVEGSLTIDGSTITEASFDAALTEIVSDRSRRDNAIQSALNTSSNPQASFELGEPIDLDGEPARGETITSEAVGELTINGVTNPVTLPLEAVWTEDDLIAVTGSVDVALSDHDVQAPSAPAVVSVSDTATIELQLFLSR